MTNDGAMNSIQDQRLSLRAPNEVVIEIVFILWRNSHWCYAKALNSQILSVIVLWGVNLHYWDLKLQQVTTNLYNQGDDNLSRHIEHSDTVIVVTTLLVRNSSVYEAISTQVTSYNNMIMIVLCVA